MLDKAYSPTSVEGKWTAAWKKAGVAHSKPSGDPGSRYVIVIPPPNVTGALHIGHALNNTLQDILIRWHALLGRSICWVPGTDHGGIATQNVMEKQLKTEKLSRQALGREKFLERMRVWTRDCKKTIMGQLERLGCLLDLEREAFTMDEPRAAAVNAAFKDLWDKKLIERDQRMVNWCVRCETALSDIEVEYEDRKSKLWHLRYPVQGRPGSFVVVATTRPETMLGDTAVAVNPSDARYAELLGKTLTLPLMDRVIPVVADPHVDASFGTGAVKVTPGHDPNDFEIWQRHPGAVGAPIQVIGHEGRMTGHAGIYAGLSREAARAKVLEDLQARGLLEKTEDYSHSVGVCYRCQQPIEPLICWQWFMRMKPSAEKALAVLNKRAFKIYPESWEGPYRAWLENIRDWCLSRQIWWGHRIPVWYCLGCNKDILAGRQGYEFYTTPDLKVASVGADRPIRCPACGAAEFVQDPDVLDTWFSSALWPLSVFGWPGKTPDLAFHYPTSVLVTGYEILYLWVARMQMMGLEFDGRPPFAHALIHGIVRDKHGKKMSKSLGNVVDPLLMMDKHGTDAFRFSLAVQAHPGRDIPYSEESITGARNFANKLWNSTRYVLLNLPEQAPPGGYPLKALDPAALELADRWILSEFQAMEKRVKEKMEAYGVAAAADELYAFLWDKFCDWYVELAKLRLMSKDEEAKLVPRTVLVRTLAGTLKLLHPFMPFITEELYAALKPFAGEDADLLLHAGAPLPGGFGQDEKALSEMAFLMGAVGSIRALRSQLNVPPALKIEALYSAKNGGEEALLRGQRGYLTHLARIAKLTPALGGRPPQSATAAAGGLVFYVPLAGIIDLEKEKKRLTKEVERLAAELSQCETRLSDKAFLARAPGSEIDKIRRRREAMAAEHGSLVETMRGLDSP